MSCLSIVLLFVWADIWAMFLTSRMLNALFQSAVGKRRHQYLSLCTWFQRLTKTYIPLITSYRHKLSRYLTFNNILIWICTLGMVALTVARRFYATLLETAICIYATVGMICIFLPPIVLSFILTRYRGGHPHYEFDLDADFINGDARNEKKKLLHDAKNSLLLTPEEFAMCRKLRF